LVYQPAVLHEVEAKPSNTKERQCLAVKWFRAGRPLNKMKKHQNKYKIDNMNTYSVNNEPTKLANRRSGAYNILKQQLNNRPGVEYIADVLPYIADKEFKPTFAASIILL